MQNKRIRKHRGVSRSGIIQEHINNNLKDYIIVTIIFIVRSINRCIVYK